MQEPGAQHERLLVRHPVRERQVDRHLPAGYLLVRPGAARRQQSTGGTEGIGGHFAIGTVRLMALRSDVSRAAPLGDRRVAVRVMWGSVISYHLHCEFYKCVVFGVR